MQAAARLEVLLVVGAAVRHGNEMVGLEVLGAAAYAARVPVAGEHSFALASPRVGGAAALLALVGWAVHAVGYPPTGPAGLQHGVNRTCR